MEEVNTETGEVTGALAPIDAGSKEVGAVDEDLLAQLAADAKDVAAVERTSLYPSLRITQDKKFVLEGVNLKDPFRCIILLAAFENSYYKAAYDPDEIAPPDCFALGYEEDLLAPPADLATKQADACAICPLNEWGSGRGKGKACSNHRKLALLEPEPKSVKDGQVCFVRLAPTSLANYAKYVKRVAAMHTMPPYAVVSRLSFDKDKGYPVVTFETEKLISDPTFLRGIMDLRERIKPLLIEPPQSKAAVEEKEAKPEKKEKRAKY